MKTHYPAFKLHREEGKNICWTGTAQAIKKDGSTLKQLEVKIEIPHDYPTSFPRVSDVSKSLKPQNCPHLTHVGGNDYILCYGNRLDGELDFNGTTRIKDVVNYTCIFLAQQWHYEKRGYWPKGQAHGILPFLRYEIYEQTILSHEICPCGLGDRHYGACHMPNVRELLNILDLSATPKVCGEARRIERNEICPFCDKKKKYKKCCALNVNYSESKTFLLLKYPKVFGMSEQDRDRFLETIIRIADQSHEEAQKKNLKETNEVPQR